VLVAQSAEPLLAQTSISNVRYAVTYDTETAKDRAIRVDMSFETDAADPIALALPAWTPGSYELDNFARHVRNFSAESDGGPVRWDKVDYDTWRVHPAGARIIKVSFDYRADTLDTGMAWSTPDFAFFNGTNLFLYPEGEAYEFPAEVTIHTEPDWLVATGMTPAGDPGVYTANTYHEVVDMPTFIGRFDLDSAEVGGTRHRLATYPEGVLTGEARAQLWDQIRQMMPPMEAVFGETPFDTYTTLAVFPDAFPGGSALEHSNSHLGLYTRQLIGSPILASVLAHEIFHAWNVKRLRPSELVPYDYGRAQPTTLLWVSEGITSYYSGLALVRGGTVPPELIYQSTADRISTVRATPPVALEDASVSTWIEPDDGTAYIYYPKGALAGFMLDILIRDASNNRSSLDEVMRSLYAETYKNGSGFTDEEWWEAVAKAAGGPAAIDFEAFRAAYIDGRDPYPWARVLALAGLDITADTVHSPLIGIFTEEDELGVRISQLSPGGAAQSAGVLPGDYVLRVGDVEVRDDSFGAAYRETYQDSPAGTPLEIVVRRGAEELTFDMELRFRESVRYTITESSNSSEKATRVRQGILKGTVDS
jgi:predicted metalloprotease with PDZ domain